MACSALRVRSASDVTFSTNGTQQSFGVLRTDSNGARQNPDGSWEINYGDNRYDYISAEGGVVSTRGVGTDSRVTYEDKTPLTLEGILAEETAKPGYDRRYGGSADYALIGAGIGAGIAAGLGELAKDGALVRAAQKLNSASTALRHGLKAAATNPVVATIAGMVVPGNLAGDDVYFTEAELFQEYLDRENGLLPGQYINDGLQKPEILVNPIASPGIDRPLGGYSPAYIDNRPLATPIDQGGAASGILPGSTAQPQGVDIVMNESNITEWELNGTKITTKPYINSAGEVVDRHYVNGQDDLLAIADGIAGGSLDNFNEKKSFWYHSPDGQVRIEWNPEGHMNTNEGPHVTHREWDGRRHSVKQKYFINGYDNYKPDWKVYSGK